MVIIIDHIVQYLRQIPQKKNTHTHTKKNKQKHLKNKLVQFPRFFHPTAISNWDLPTSPSSAGSPSHWRVFREMTQRKNEHVCWRFWQFVDVLTLGRPTHNPGGVAFFCGVNLRWLRSRSSGATWRKHQRNMCCSFNPAWKFKHIFQLWLWGGLNLACHVDIHQWRSNSKEDTTPFENSKISRSDQGSLSPTGSTYFESYGTHGTPHSPQRLTCWMSSTCQNQMETHSTRSPPFFGIFLHTFYFFKTKLTISQ